MLLPKKDSQQWFLVFLISWFINIFALVITRYQVGFVFDYPTTLVFVSLSLLVASITSLGWFGLFAFTKTFMFFNLVAILNMFLITSQGIEDAFMGTTSLLNYIFFISMGTLAGLLIEVVKVYFDKEEAKLLKQKIAKKTTKKTTTKKAPAKKKTTTKKK